MDSIGGPVAPTGIGEYRVATRLPGANGSKSLPADLATTGPNPDAADGVTTSPTHKNSNARSDDETR
jgi:hypothetical protein